MQVSVETLKGLERKMTVSVPTEKVEEEVGLRLKNLARKVKVDGYRPGKVPLKLVERRFSSDVRQEVVRDMVQSTLYEALKDKNLMPAGRPFVEPEQVEAGKDFKYTAVFEVYPEITVKELNNAEVEVFHANVKEENINDMLNNLLKQHKDWKEVSRAVTKNDKVVIDFEGFLDGKPFEGGHAKDYEIELGSGQMIPGFEEGIIDAHKDKQFDLNVKFPENYGHKDLAGKDVVFKVTVKKIMEGQLPALDDEFAKKFNVKEGGVEALKNDIRQNMERELERRLSEMNRKNVFDKWVEYNPFDLPKALIDQEIEHLKHEMYHRIFGHQHSDNEKIPDFPRELFEKDATRRVHVGLLFAEYVKINEMVADKEQVDAMLEKFATAYEKPEELRAWYRGNKERMAEIEALVLEEMVSEKIRKDAKIIKKNLKYDDVMNPKPEQAEQDKGE